MVFYNAKIIQLLCCNSSCKGSHGTLYKQLCWEVWGNSQLYLDYILGPFDRYYDLLGNSVWSADPFHLAIRFFLN